MTPNYFAQKVMALEKSEFSTFLTFLKIFRFFSRTTLPNLEFWVSMDRKSCGKLRCVGGDAQIFLHINLWPSEKSRFRFVHLFLKHLNFSRKLHFQTGADLGFSRGGGGGGFFKKILKILTTFFFRSTKLIF